MNTLSLLKIPFSDLQLKDAVTDGLEQGMNTPLLDKFSVENSLEYAVKNSIHSHLNNMEINKQYTSYPSPIGSGMKTNFMVTLQVQIDYKVSFKAGLHAGLEYRSADFYTNQSLHFSFGNLGLGTPIYDNNKEKRKMVIDATVYLGIGIGSKQGVPMNQYVINYDTPIPVQNTFRNSGSYGQALTWNSAINQKFDLKDIQRQGIINLRFGDFSLSTNNDTKRLYMGGGTDHGWTGGIILSFAVANFGIIETGYQNFTGKYNEKGHQEQQMDTLTDLKKKGEIDKDEFKRRSQELLEQFPYHSQDNLQKSFNRASNFLRIQKDMNSIRLDIESNGWFQNLIHNQIRDFKFEYNNPKPIGIWIEKAF